MLTRGRALRPREFVQDATGRIRDDPREGNEMQDRRQMPRLRSLKGGRIEFNRHWPPVECVVRNISKHGACLEIDGQYNTSLEFNLTFLQANDTRACRQIWRQDGRIGVAFLSWVA
jgi:hypothetical protein